MVTRTVNPYVSILRFLLILIVLITGIGAGYFGLKAYKKWQSLVTTTQRDLQKKVYEQAHELDVLLTSIAQQAERAAQELSNEKNPDIERILKKLWDTSPLIGSTGVAYAYSTQEKPFSLFVTKKGAGARTEFITYHIEKYYDYREQGWYKDAFAGTARWSQPFIEVTSNLSVVRYAVPISRFNAATATRENIGVLFIDLSHAELAEAISKMTQALRGYSFVLSENDDLITYPIQEDVEIYKTLFNISRLPGKQGLKDVAQAINRTRAGVTRYHDMVSQESFWVSFAPLSAAPWYIVLFSGKDDLFFNRTIRTYLLRFLFLCILFFLAVYIVLGGLLTGTTKQWWLFSYIAAGCFIGITAFQLYVFYYSSLEIAGRTPIRSRVELTRFEQFQNRLNQQLKKPPLIYVPTGLSMNHVVLASATTVEVSGIIWQKYDIAHHKNLKQSIAIENAEELTLTPLYKETKGNIQTVGWSFFAKLNVQFDKLQYPFDTQTIVMTLFHPSFKENVILVPDFLAYDSADIGRFIGLSKNFRLVEDWVLKDSYYYYHAVEKKTNFGLSSAVRKESFPDLNFAVVVTRNILNPLVAYVLPLIIISIILFYILLGSSADEVTISTTIGQISGLFLATVLAHQTFRRALDINIIVYLESFYFLLYFITILVASNCMIYAVQSKSETLLSYLRRYVVKFFYWPLLFFLVFLITLYFFR